MAVDTSNQYVQLQAIHEPLQVSGSKMLLEESTEAARALDPEQRARAAASGGEGGRTDQTGRVVLLDTRDVDELARLEEKLLELETREVAVGKELHDFDLLWKGRRQPLEMEMEEVRTQKQQVIDDIERAKALENDEDIPPGPAQLRWVDGARFGAICNLIVVLNLTSMLLGPKFPDYAPLLKIADHVFMVWYVFELTVKFVLHQRGLVCGKISVVWWNWLDLVIVVSGVVDMWLMPIILALAGVGHETGAPNMSALRTLRLCRLFRVFRFLKLLKVFLHSDLAWAESAWFQAIMSCVIAVNAVVMSLELDYPGPVWTWVENAFLVIYLTELCIRAKRQGYMFFVSLDTILWNYLDLVIIVGGVFDLWMQPLIHLFQSAVLGQETGPKNSNLSNITSLLKMMRILRVLRLVKLLKTIKPLYRLMLGVVESLKAMQWVMVLTLLMLYAAAIFWTSLVGKGLMYNGDPPEEVVDVFGSVPKSIFSLFKLMNGDTEVVEAVTQTVFGQLLFVCFMVLSNWAILAILTSVVSDNMISVSAQAQEEDDAVEKAAEDEARCARLLTLFKEIDDDQSGEISAEEWRDMLQDKGLLHELCDATRLKERDLEELFSYLAVDVAVDPSNRHSARHGHSEKILHYDALIEHIRSDAEPADRRSVLRMLSRMQALELSIEKKVEASLERKFQQFEASARPGN